MNEPRSTAVIEAQLRQAAGEVVWPATPDLRSSVLSRLDGTPTRRSVVPRRALRTAVAVAVLLVVAVLAHPGARTAVAEFFGLVEGYRIEVVPAATVPMGASTVPPAAATATPLDGAALRTTIEAATTAVGFVPVLLTGETQPEIYLARIGERAFVILRYSRFDLWESRDGVPGMIVKTLPEGTVIETPTVRGRPAFWISGLERSMRFVDGDGRDIGGSKRTVGRNALIWSGFNRLYRLETDLPLVEALRLANSLP